MIKIIVWLLIDVIFKMLFTLTMAILAVLKLPFDIINKVKYYIYSKNQK